MRTTSRLIRTVLVAAGLLAISASAAQAMPTRQSTDAGKNPGFAATGHPGGPSSIVPASATTGARWFSTARASCSATN